MGVEVECAAETLDDGDAAGASSMEAQRGRSISERAEDSRQGRGVSGERRCELPDRRVHLSRRRSPRLELHGAGAPHLGGTEAPPKGLHLLLPIGFVYRHMGPSAVRTASTSRSSASMRRFWAWRAATARLA